MKTNWSVLAIFPEPESRENTVLFCDELVRRFWNQYEFTVSWFAHEDVRDPEKTEQLRENAQKAQLVVLGAGIAPIPPDVFAVIESQLLARSKKEGLLAGIVPQGSRNELALRNLAHRHGMDYISEVPPALDGAIPDSPESCASRANEVSHLLSDILRKPPTSTPRLF